MSLEGRLNALTASGFKPNPNRTNMYSGDQLIKKKLFFINTGEVHEAVVDMILLGATLPKVYLHENRDGTCHIVHGEEIVETILAVLESPKYSNEALADKFRRVSIDFVTFDWKVDRANVMYFIKNVVCVKRHDD